MSSKPLGGSHVDPVLSFVLRYEAAKLIEDAVRPLDRNIPSCPKFELAWDKAWAVRILH